MSTSSSAAVPALDVESDGAPAAKRRKLNPSDDSSNGVSTEPHAAAPSNSFVAARELLHSSRIPEQLVGRESEERRLRDFFSKCFRDAQGCSLYLSGHPGTGKTASVVNLLKQLSSPSASKNSKSTTEVPLGSVVFINCMRYASLSVKRLCSLLHARVAEHSARVSDALDLDSLESAETKNIKLIGSSDEQCFDELENIILSQSDMTVLILDEIDHLITSPVKKKFLYRLFEIAHTPGSLFTLVGIANTLDLPERLLPNLAVANITPTSIQYKSYSSDQLVAIIRDRLGPTAEEVFDKRALELAAKKVAENCFGDARKILSMCSQAAADVAASQAAVEASATASSPQKPKPISIGVMNKLSQSYIDSGAASLVRVQAPQPASALTTLAVAEQSMAKPLSATARMIQGFPLHQQLALLAIQQAFACKSSKDLLLPVAYNQYKSFCKLTKSQNQDEPAFAALCQYLESYGLVSIAGGTSDVKKRKLTPSVPIDECVNAIHDNLVLKPILSSMTGAAK